MDNQVGADRAPAPVVLPALSEGQAAVLIAGIVLPRVEHVVFPEAHRADAGYGLLFGGGKGQIPAARAGVDTRGLLRSRLRLRSRYGRIGAVIRPANMKWSFLACGR